MKKVTETNATIKIEKDRGKQKVTAKSGLLSYIELMVARIGNSKHMFVQSRMAAGFARGQFQSAKGTGWWGTRVFVSENPVKRCKSQGWKCALCWQADKPASTGTNRGIAQEEHAKTSNLICDQVIDSLDKSVCYVGRPEMQCRDRFIR